MASQSEEFTLVFQRKFRELSESGLPSNEAAAAALTFASAHQASSEYSSMQACEEPKLSSVGGFEQPKLKRSRSLEEWACHTGERVALAPVGEELTVNHFVPRTRENVSIRHGSSLDLIRQGHLLINSEFNETDPEKDFKKWLSKGASPYFLLVVEASGIVSCCLRCLLDGDWASYWPSGSQHDHPPTVSPSPGAAVSCAPTLPPPPPPPMPPPPSALPRPSSHEKLERAHDTAATTGECGGPFTIGGCEDPLRGESGACGVMSGDDGAGSGSDRYCTRRIVVDYVVTLEQCQGRGHAGHLLSLVDQVASSARANLYVLALEDSCVYWMSKGFELEPGPINRRLNVFPDTHLLRLPTNAPEHPQHIPPEEDDGDGDDGTGGGGGRGRGADGEERGASSSSARNKEGGDDSDDEDEDEEDDGLALALAESAAIAESKAMAEDVIFQLPSSCSSSSSSFSSSSSSSSSSSTTTSSPAVVVPPRSGAESSSATGMSTSESAEGVVECHSDEHTDDSLKEAIALSLAVDGARSDDVSGLNPSSSQQGNGQHHGQSLPPAQLATTTMTRAPPQDDEEEQEQEEELALAIAMSLSEQRGGR